MIRSKSITAFQMTAERLWRPGFRVYFWTFTFREVESDWDCLAAWAKLQTWLRKTFPTMGGVRVSELHKSHGVHFHMLCDQRLDVNHVRSEAWRFGFGRINVKVADQNPGGASGYLCKYLSKCREGPLCKSGRKSRRWAAFGKVIRTRVSDLVNDSLMWQFRRLHNFWWLGYRREKYLLRIWNYGDDNFKAGWFAAKSGRVGDLVGLATGRLESRGLGELVERFKLVGMECPF